MSHTISLSGRYPIHNLMFKCFLSSYLLWAGSEGRALGFGFMTLALGLTPIQDCKPYLTP